LSPELQQLRDSLSCVTYSGEKHTHIKIKESDPLAQLKTLNIKVPNGDWFVFDPDKGRGKPPLMSPLLATGKHQHHRACDAVIVVLKPEGLNLIFIDLKSSAPSGFAGQFQSTRQFTCYLLGLLHEFHGISFKPVLERFVIFQTPRNKRVLLAKKPTVFRCINRSSSDPKAAQKELVHDGATLYLKQLLA
jgi:hypothetical protein